MPARAWVVARWAEASDSTARNSSQTWLPNSVGFRPKEVNHATLRVDQHHGRIATHAVVPSHRAARVEEQDQEAGTDGRAIRGRRSVSASCRDRRSRSRFRSSHRHDVELVAVGGVVIGEIHPAGQTAAGAGPAPVAPEFQCRDPLHPLKSLRRCARLWQRRRASCKVPRWRPACRRRAGLLARGST